MRTTHTYATTNIVIMQMAGGAAGFTVYAEDFSRPTPDGMIHPARLERLIDTSHLRAFDTMREFTEWLHEVGAVVDECRVLGETLTDEERQPDALQLGAAAPKAGPEVGY